MDVEVTLGDKVVLVNRCLLLKTSLGIRRFANEIKPEVSVPGFESKTPATIVRSKVVVVPDADHT